MENSFSNNKFISSEDNEEGNDVDHVMHSNCDNKETMINDKADKVVE